MLFSGSPSTFRYQLPTRNLIFVGGVLLVVIAAQPLHGVSIDVVGDRLAYGVADFNGARVVHTAPDPAVVTVRARLRDAGVGAARLSGRRQRKRLSSPEVAEKNGRSRTVEAGVPGRVFRVRRSVNERQPVRIWSSKGIAVGVRQRYRGYRPPSHGVRIGAVESLGAPDGERGIGHRDIQNRKKPIAVGDGQVVGACNLVCCLIPVSAGVALPERSERRLVCRARRSGVTSQRLDCGEIGRVCGTGQTSRWTRPELSVTFQNEHQGKCQALRAHRSERRRCRPPLADRESHP